MTSRRDRWYTVAVTAVIINMAAVVIRSHISQFQTLLAVISFSMVSLVIVSMIAIMTIDFMAIREKERIARGESRRSIVLTKRLSQAEPLAWLVLCPDGCSEEYKVFQHRINALHYASACDYEFTDIFPMYAGEPK